MLEVTKQTTVLAREHSGRPDANLLRVLGVPRSPLRTRSIYDDFATGSYTLECTRTGLNTFRTNLFIVHLENSLVFRTPLSRSKLSVLPACTCFSDSLRKLEIGFRVLERLDLLHLQDSILISNDVNESISSRFTSRPIVVFALTVICKVPR